MSSHIARLLAIDPTPQGFAYAVLEGPDFLVDWGIVHFSGGIALAKERFDTLVLRYLPDGLVVEDYSNTRRGRPAKAVIRRLEARSKLHDIPVSLISREEVKAYFRPTGFKKHEIAEEIAKRFPELRSRIPKRRRLWESEAERMSIFDAVSFALTALGSRKSSDISF
jgi:hypothetical protein